MCEREDTGRFEHQNWDFMYLTRIAILQDREQTDENFGAKMKEGMTIRSHREIQKYGFDHGGGGEGDKKWSNSIDFE
jgi:hypothetical protein